ncbi:MAG: hypothetical protein NWE89_17460 [Candidatus Bathyarchaeota archaeon]|nr:hypothetical protein [Candidatus Bathyarchaeota archaeon]
MKLSNAIRTGKVLLPQLASLLWAHKQALLQEREAAGQERERWQVVQAVIEHRIREQEREITECLDVLKFKTKGEVF